jgi:hypothetical protein
MMDADRLYVKNHVIHGTYRHNPTIPPLSNVCISIDSSLLTSGSLSPANLAPSPLS